MYHYISNFYIDNFYIKEKNSYTYHETFSGLFIKIIL